MLPESQGVEPGPIASRGVPQDWSTGDLDAWLAESRSDAAARSRRIEQNLTRQASEEASVAGILRDLGERGEPITLTTVAGSTHRGRVRAVGGDFLVLYADDRQGETVIAFRAVDFVRVPSGATVRGDRAEQLEVTLAEVLPEMAADRPEVVVVTSAGHRVRGELRSAGLDVARIRTDDAERATAYVPVSAIAELLLP